FNTTSSMGRLTLNVLLSFAQLEREVTGERIRDKIAASKKKGIWMGDNVPLGYDASERTLVINPAEVETVRRIFALYRELGCVRRVKEEADRLGLRTKCRTTTDEIDKLFFRWLASHVGTGWACGTARAASSVRRRHGGKEATGMRQSAVLLEGLLLCSKAKWLDRALPAQDSIWCV